MTPLRLTVQIIILCMYLALPVLCVYLLAQFTYVPMMANYRECGTIFLCKNQH